MISTGWGPGLSFLGAHVSSSSVWNGPQAAGEGGNPSPLHCREQESQTSGPLCPSSWSEGGRFGSRG